MLKNMIKNYFTILLLSAFLISGTMFISCGKKDTNTAGDQKDSTQTQTPNDQSAGSKNNPQEQNKTTNPNPNELGISEGLPKDYPSDVPQPKNAKNMGYLTTSEGTVVTFESDEKPKDILSDFKTEIEKNGYKKDDSGDALMSRITAGSLYRKGYKGMQRYPCAWDKEKKKSSIVVTYK